MLKHLNEFDDLMDDAVNKLKSNEFERLIQRIIERAEEINESCE